MKVSTEIDNNFGYEKITQLVDNIPLISQFDILYQHRNGKNHTNADALSRRRQEETGKLKEKYTVQSQVTTIIIHR